MALLQGDVVCAKCGLQNGAHRAPCPDTHYFPRPTALRFYPVSGVPVEDRRTSLGSAFGQRVDVHYTDRDGRAHTFAIASLREAHLAIANVRGAGGTPTLLTVETGRD